MAALILTATACARAESPIRAEGSAVPATLRVGLIPNVSPDRQRAIYRPFGDYLARVLEVKVELFVASDYTGVVAALAGGRIDTAYLGGLTYIQAAEQVPLTPIVTEIDRDTGSQMYVSAVVVRRDAPYEELEDIVAKGGSFAFGDVSSTSGSLYPRIMLTQAGARCSAEDVLRCPPLRRVTFTGGHDATALAVLSAKADAGGIELRILRKLESDGTVPPDALRVIAQRKVQGYPWVVRTKLGPRVRDALTEAFTSITDPELLDLLRARAYVAVRPSDYDEIRKHARKLGLVETPS